MNMSSIVNKINTFLAKTQLLGFRNRLGLSGVGTSLTEVKEAGWQGVVFYPATGALTHVASTEINDKGKTLTVVGLSTDGEMLYESITLDATSGQTPVPLLLAYRRINAVRVATPDDITLGTVSFAHADPTTEWTAGVPANDKTLMVITAGNRESHSLIHATQEQYGILHLVEFIFRVEANGGTFVIETRDFGDTDWYVEDTIILAADTRTHAVYDVPIAVRPRSDVRIRAKATATTTNIHARVNAGYI
jgi:hypothetical protein